MYAAPGARYHQRPSGPSSCRRGSRCGCRCWKEGWKIGLEWHNRKRSTNGRFAKRARGLRYDADIEIDQLHIRLPRETAEHLREVAIDQQMEITELVEAAIDVYLEELDLEKERDGQIDEE